MITVRKQSCESYVFTPVCLSTGGGGSASVHAGITPPPPEQTPTLGTDPLRAHPNPPWRQTHPPPTPPPHTHSRRLLLWMVCILLECIFVSQCFAKFGFKLVSSLLTFQGPHTSVGSFSSFSSWIFHYPVQKWCYCAMEMPILCRHSGRKNVNKVIL